MTTPSSSIVLGLVSLAVVVCAFCGCGQSSPEYEIVEAEDFAVRLPRARVADGRVHFFTYLHGRRRVNFLVRTDGTGKLQVHLDACYACYRYKMGYFVEGTHLVCRACRYEYAIADELWDYIGACAPIPIASHWEGDELVVERSVLEKAARYF